MQYQITYNDPETLTRPLTVSLAVDYRADTDMLENVCNENNRDTARLVGTAVASASLDAAVLATYTGHYAFSEGSRTVAGFMGSTQHVSLVNGQLYLNAIPLTPVSATTFESTGAVAEFFVDSSGRVTRLVLTQTEGDATYAPKR
jgi:hypothetical protein